MRPSLRFLLVAVIGWAGLRAATLGALPGAEIFRIARSEAKPPPIVPTQFPPIEPIAPAAGGDAWADMRPQAMGYADPRIMAGSSRPVAIPIYYAPAELRPGLGKDVGEPSWESQWPLSRIAATSMPPLRSSVVTPAQSKASLKRNGVDRVQLTAWALLRARAAGIAGQQSLANGGSLGGSQAGARLSYNFARQMAAPFRSTSEVGRRGGEVAAGVRIQPAAAIPLWITAERRQRVGRYGGGRNAFALFFEAGVWDRPMPLHFLLDSYLQGGIVGFHSRDRFVDGSLTLTRPLYKQFSAGLGVWGGAQPGVYRVDAGPRMTMRIKHNLRVHLDWRQRLAGNAAPGSGPAITLAGDF